MQKRAIGPFTVNPIGLGCMNLSHAYGVPPERSAAITLLNEALDLGYDHFDTAALYGFGANETLIGEAVGHRRADYLLASKCVLGRGPDGKRVIDGRPETIKATCEAALQRLRTEVIDLYYLHRLDRTVPIEESVGALVDLIAAGKIRAIGLSEMGAETLRKAHAVHPIAALQTEYSLWSREAEIAVLQACQDLGIAFVAFSPVARGFLTGTLRDLSGLPDNDIRRGMPRFQPEAYGQNLALLDVMEQAAAETGVTMAQIALAWVLGKGNHIHAIPGTTDLGHLRDNIAAGPLSLPGDLIARLEARINNSTVTGPRYPAGAQADVDTEMFA